MFLIVTKLKVQDIYIYINRNNYLNKADISK